MKLHYVSGSRADFGLMVRTLEALNYEADFELGVIATGQHTAAGYGGTITDIKTSKVPLLHTIPVKLSGRDGLEMAEANALQLSGFAKYWTYNRPDMVLTLGDRGEMLMAAVAAAYLGIPVGHFHGGERSGTIDESLRHAISKISHFHFTATEDARQRLIKLGEREDQIWTVGAPGLVGLTDGITSDRAWLCCTFNIRNVDTLALLIFHPVVQEQAQAGEQISTILDAMQSLGLGGLILRPNSDAGGHNINDVLDSFMSENNFAILDHLPRDIFKKVLASVDLFVGNTSSGIIESASFGIPFVNIGSRQNGRLRNSNVIECPVIAIDEIISALRAAKSLSGPFENIYGDGDVAQRLIKVLRTTPPDNSVLSKLNTY